MIVKYLHDGPFAALLVTHLGVLVNDDVGLVALLLVGGAVLLHQPGVQGPPPRPGLVGPRPDVGEVGVGGVHGGQGGAAPLPRHQHHHSQHECPHRDHH